MCVHGIAISAMARIKRMAWGDDDVLQFCAAAHGLEVWQSAEDSGYASRMSHEQAFFSGGFHGLLFIFLYCSFRKILQA